MALNLALSDLSRLDKIRAALANDEHHARFSDLGMDQLTVDEGASDDLVATLERQLRRAGLEPGPNRRVCVIVDDVVILRNGESLKDLLLARLAAKFEVSRIVLTDGHTVLHADEPILDRAAAGAVGADAVVSIGGGTITDIAKIAAMRNKTPVHIVVQTAASVDGYTDNFSVVLQKGVKRTLLTRWPDAVLTDVSVIAQAPRALNASGLGELLSLYCAPGDWLLAARCGMGETFTPMLIEMLELCGAGVEDWASGVRNGDLAAAHRLAAALAMRGIVSGVGGTTAILSGMEHLFSHMLDIHGAETGAATGLHGAQVGVGSVIAAAAWEEFCERMEKTPVDPARMNLAPDEAEARVRAAFASLDSSGRLGGQCWGHYREKLAKWNNARAPVASVFADWPAFRAEHDAMVMNSARLAACLHRGGSPMRPSDLDPAVPVALTRWTVANCQFMRERFTIADLLTFAGWWDEDAVTRVLDRAEAACAAAEQRP